MAASTSSSTRWIDSSGSLISVRLDVHCDFMNHYDFPTQFRKIFDHAVALYATGRKGAETFFDSGQRAWLSANGITPQYIYDYAEDENGGGEPGFGHALTIETVRRDYFLNVQKGQASAAVLDEATLPAKADKA